MDAPSLDDARPREQQNSWGCSFARGCYELAQKWLTKAENWGPAENRTNRGIRIPMRFSVEFITRSREPVRKVNGRRTAPGTSRAGPSPVLPQMPGSRPRRELLFGFARRLARRVEQPSGGFFEAVSAPRGVLWCGVTRLLLR